MSKELLSRLGSDDVHDSIVCYSSPAAIRRLLSRRREVIDLRAALQNGSLTDDELRRHVVELMHGFRPGQRFDGDVELAALAVAIERRSTDFAEEFFHDLASLKLRELSMSIGIARLILHARQDLAKNESRVIKLGEPAHQSKSFSQPNGRGRVYAMARNAKKFKCGAM
jgi:hypothetical protein